MPKLTTKERTKRTADWLFVVLCGSAWLPMFKYDFMPSPAVAEAAVHLAAILTIATLASLFYLHRRGIWEPAPAFFLASRIKRTLILPFAPVFVWSIFWVNLSGTLPHVYTLLFGQDVTREGAVVKKKDSSRRRCDYSIEQMSYHHPLFRFCISASRYQQLPNGELQAVLHIRQSSFGYVVEEVAIADAR